MEKMKKQIRLSQCMIVKNEEANIEKALSWGKEIAYEQIVVDTGSTDKTVELAKAMGAKVYSFAWIDDFAAAKNFAISKASGDWIAFLDADEIFAEGDEKKLMSLLATVEKQAGQTHALWITRLEMGEKIVVGSIAMLRVFRRLPGLCYHRRIHEYLAWEDNRQLNTVDITDSLSIIHTGYRHEASQKKENRNLKLILKELEENPNDEEMLGYLGDEYYGSGEYDEAIDCYWKAIEHMPACCSDSDQRSAGTLMRLMYLLLDAKKNYSEVERVYQVAVSHMSKEADFEYIYGISLGMQGRFAESRQHLELALTKLAQGRVSGSVCLSAELPNAYRSLAWCCLKLGDSQKAVEYCVQLLKADASDSEALRILLLAFRGTDTFPIVSPEQTINFLGKICDLISLHGRYFVSHVAEAGVYPELAIYMEAMFSQEEKAALEKAGL